MKCLVRSMLYTFILILTSTDCRIRRGDVNFCSCCLLLRCHMELRGDVLAACAPAADCPCGRCCAARRRARAWCAPRPRPATTEGHEAALNVGACTSSTTTTTNQAQAYFVRTRCVECGLVMVIILATLTFPQDCCV